MNHAGSKSSCTMWCFIIAGLIGLIAFLLLLVVGDWRVLSALILGVLIAAVAAVVFPMMFCGNNSTPVSAGTAGTDAGSAPTTTDTKATSAAAATATSGASTSAAAAGAAPASLMSAPAVKPSTPLAGETELANKKGDWKYEGDAKPAKKPAAKKTATKKAVAKKPAAKKAASKSAEKPAAKTASKAAPKPKAPPVAKDGQPPLLKKARAGGADDLKQIKGVGPGLEKTLNELGFYHFDQVAAWRKKEIEWVDSRLKFKGRIVRDEWTKQCKTLAKGGATEFSKRVKKGDVY